MYRQDGQLGEKDNDTWPEMTQNMNSIIKDEIAKVKKILKDVKGAKYKEEFRTLAGRVLSREEIKPRETVLREKVEQSLPSKDHHTVKVLWAAIYFSSWIQVKIALEITVTKESHPEALKSALEHKGNIVWFCGSQGYKVNLPTASNQPLHADNSSSHATGVTSKPGSGSDDFKRSENQNSGAYSGTVVEVTVNEQEMTDGSFLSGA